MNEEPLYELLKDMEDPNGKVISGTMKTKHQWMGRFALLTEEDLELKKDWFKKVKPILFNEEDLKKFAKKAIERAGAIRPFNESTVSAMIDELFRESIFYIY